ncbi:hypothetical protein [Mycobacterium sp. AZCC_0083]|uniref:hypothetical protein n=1 Tax=Mycobacterium sp. AZCC_0083 TaxID=2735882 RepID=UPI0016145238|nr:hypothetical protein [Mycobacterium sp. AZCC_0083]MBB5164100.1 hypothetical protein [Mycobacterium sp. AZCC_0083]
MTDPETPEDLVPEDLAMLAEHHFPHESKYADSDLSFGGVFRALAGMNEREKEEFLLLYAPRKVRKTIKERRKAREQAQKQGG